MEVAEQTIREQLFDAIANSPGTSPYYLSKQLELPRTTVRNHLRILLEFELIFEGPKGGGLFIYGYEGLLLKQPERWIFQAIQEHGLASIRKLSDLLGYSRRVLHYNIRKLRDDGWLPPYYRNGWTPRESSWD